MTRPSDVASLVGQWLSSRGQQDPYPVYRHLHQHGPVLGVPGGTTLVVGYAEAQLALRHPRLLVEDAAQLDGVAPGWRAHRSVALLNRSMLFVNGDRHERMRRLVDRTFTARRVDALLPALRTRVAELGRRLETRGDDVEFVQDFAYQLPVNVICDILGVPGGDRQGFRGPVARLAEALDPGWPQLDLEKADAAALLLGDYFTGLVEARRRRPQDDLVSAMVRAAEVDRELSDDGELVANLVLMLLAGFETTVGLLGHGLVALARDPAVHARLHRRKDLVRPFVSEVLRYDTPVQLTGRRAESDLRLGSQVAPEGSQVVIALGAALRDPRHFACPDVFDLDRPAALGLSFGSGRHYCVGARLARLEAETAFEMITERYRRVELSGAPEPLGRLNLRAHAALPVRLTRAG